MSWFVDGWMGVYGRASTDGYTFMYILLSPCCDIGTHARTSLFDHCAWSLDGFGFGVLSGEDHGFGGEESCGWARLRSLYQPVFLARRSFLLDMGGWMRHGWGKWRIGPSISRICVAMYVHTDGMAGDRWGRGKAYTRGGSTHAVSVAFAGWLSVRSRGYRVVDTYVCFLFGD